MNFLTYHSDPNIYSRAPFFRANLEYRSNFQKKLGSSPPDQHGLQTIRENSVLSIFESHAGFLNLMLGFRSILTCQTDPNIYSMTPVFRATLQNRSNFQKIFGLSPPDQHGLQTIRENSVSMIFWSILRFYVNFSTYHTDPNIYSMAPIFWATLEYRSNFQKKVGSSPPDQHGLQTIRENSVSLIFLSILRYTQVLGQFFNISYRPKYLFYGTNFLGDSRI